MAKEVDVPAYRTIAFAVREGKTVSLAVKRFMEYLKYREMLPSIDKGKYA